MISKTRTSSDLKIKEITQMKKILTLAIGVGLVLGTVSFAQDKMDTKTGTEKTKKSKKSKKSTKTDTKTM